MPTWVRLLIPLAIWAGASWLSYRLVNWPKFADFLIAVEAEMNKVTWPSRQELIRSSIVVIVLILLLTAAISAFDYFWIIVFQVLGVVPSRV